MSFIADIRINRDDYEELLRIDGELLTAYNLGDIDKDVFEKCSALIDYYYKNIELRSLANSIKNKYGIPL